MIPLPDLASDSPSMSECNSEVQRCEVMRDVLARYSPSEEDNADADADPFGVDNLLGLSSDGASEKSADAAEESLDNQAGDAPQCGLNQEALIRHLAKLSDPDAMARVFADEEKKLFGSASEAEDPETIAVVPPDYNALADDEADVRSGQVPRYRIKGKRKFITKFHPLPQPEAEPRMDSLEHAHLLCAEAATAKQAGLMPPPPAPPQKSKHTQAVPPPEKKCKHTQAVQPVPDSSAARPSDAQALKDKSSAMKAVAGCKGRASALKRRRVEVRDVSDACPSDAQAAPDSSAASAIDLLSDDEPPPELIMDSSSDDDAPTRFLQKEDSNINDVRFARRSDARAARAGITGKCFRSLLRMGAPLFVLNAIYILFQCPATSNCHDLDSVEMFAGVSAVHRAMEAAMYRSAAYDVELGGELQEIISLAGFCTALQYLRRLRPGGLVHWATVCSTWVWISRSSTRRSIIEPLGEGPRSDKVKSANMMVSRMAALWYFLIACTSYLILEQPGTSLMLHHPRVKAIKDILGNDLMSVHTWMGMFGAKTNKSTKLSSNHPSVQSLHRKMIGGLQFEGKTATMDEFGKVTGNRDELHDSQAYPDPYGTAVVEVLKASDSTPHDTADVSA